MKITSSKLPSEVFCPTSKSHANRALILAAIKDATVTLLNMPKAQDVKDMLQILTEIGLKICEKHNSLEIQNSFPSCEVKSSKVIILPGSEGGTTIRFLLPLLALGTNKYRIPLLGKLGDRPFTGLVKALEQLDVSIRKEKDYIELQGPIILKTKQRLDIDCAKTTQFASALKLS